ETLQRHHRWHQTLFHESIRYFNVHGRMGDPAIHARALSQGGGTACLLSKPGLVGAGQAGRYLAARLPIARQTRPRTLRRPLPVVRVNTEMDTDMHARPTTATSRPAPTLDAETYELVQEL